MLMLRRVLVVLVGVLALGVLAAPVAFAEEGCPNEAVRQVELAAHPEGFASGLPDCRAYEQVTPVGKDGTDPSGARENVQASPSGDGIIFPVLANMPGGSSGEVPSFFLASREGGGWSDQGALGPRGPHGHGNLIGWSEDLSVTASAMNEVTSGAGYGMYLRNSADGSVQLAAPSPSVSASIYLAGFDADDSRMIFETEAQLLPSAAAGRNNLYEWHAGSVSLVGVLPDGSTPAGGSFAGPEGNRATTGFYTEHTISSGGSRVFFTAGETKQLYVREDGMRTVPVGVGQFMAATPDGSKVFYLAGSAGGDLMEFDVEGESTTDLTPGMSVQGVLGVSDDGSFVYFAANEGNLYVWHDGSVRFIISNGKEVEGGINKLNWSPFANHGGATPDRTSRVTPDGRLLLFTAADGQLDRYYVGDGALSCVSCAMDGVPPATLPTLQSIGSVVSSREPGIFLRNLSNDGSRVFFESSVALLPRDMNGVQDVYEWEQQGVGSCQGSSESFSAFSGGCLYLISSGTSPQASFFADASASGNDVFFFTDQPLVGQDQDGLVDVYDARVGGGLVAQNPPAPAAACEGEGCRPVAGGAPVFGVPVSATFTGAGNQTLPPPVVAAPKVKAKHKVLRPKRKKRRGARKAGRAARGAGVRVAIRGVK
jgi:hypothetical protein